MKIVIMVLLVAAIVAPSHMVVARYPTQNTAVEIPSYGWADLLPRAKKVRMMWLSIFAVAIVAAICLGVAAFWMWPIEVV
ncbi:MAG TPA: hypothetical protein VLW06_08985 [Terriglobales bacterium]|nr:hypothetical protein [Terriglobales bacterium]